MKLFSSMLTAIAGLILIAVPVGAVTHTVNQVGLAFSPTSLNVEVGDTVEWIWSTGVHTVTNGANLADPEVGLLFDEPLTSANPLVSYTFTEARRVNYFCRPHLNFGMTGSINVVAPSAVDDAPSATVAMLRPNVPNPFNPSTQITFALPADRDGPVAVRLRVFDLKGRLVQVLLDRAVDADRRTVSWDGRDLRGQAAPAGVYVYRLDAGGQSLSRTMTLAK